MPEIFKITVDSSAIYGYSMFYNSKMPFDGVYIQNLTDKAYEELTLNISSKPEFFEPVTVRVSAISARGELTVSPVRLKIDATGLSYLSADTNSVISFVLSSGGEVLTEYNQNIELIRFDAWGGCQNYPEILAALVTPEQHEISAIVSKVEAENGRRGYKNKSKAAVEAELEKLYNTIRDLRITYTIAPFSSDKVGDTVKLSESIISTKSANSLEISLLIASCAEALGFNPVIILFGNKALVGCYLGDRSYYSPIIDSFKTLSKLCLNDSFYLFEPSSVVNGTNISAESSKKMALAVFEDPDSFVLAVDIRTCRNNGVRSLPDRSFSEDGLQFSRSNNAFDALDIKDSFKSAKTDPVTDKISQYKSCLLDLSENNPLLDLSVSDSIIVEASNAEKLLDLADCKAEKSVIILSAEDEDGELSYDYIRTSLSASELRRKAGSIMSMQNIKTGSGTLGGTFITFGFVCVSLFEHIEPVKAPLVMIPCRLTRLRDGRFAVKSVSGNPVYNSVLFEKIKNIYGVNLFEIGNFTDFEKSVSDIREALRSVKDAELSLDRLCIGFFKPDAREKAVRINSELFESNELALSVATRKPLTLNYEFNDSSIPKYETDFPYPLSAEQIKAASYADNLRYSMISGAPGTGRTSIAVHLAYSAVKNHSKLLYVAADRRLAERFIKRLDKLGIAECALFADAGSNGKFRIKQEFSFDSAENELYTTLDKFRADSVETNDYYAALNSKRQFGFSLNDALLQYEKYISAPEYAQINRNLILSLDENGVSKWFEAVSALAAAGSEASEVCDNPLKYVRSKNFSYEKKDTALTQLKSYASNTRDLISAQNQAIDIFEQDAVISKLEQTYALVELFELINDETEVPFCYFNNDDIVSSIPKLRNVVEYGLNCLNMKNDISRVFTDEIFLIPAQEYIARWREAKLTRRGRSEQKKILSQLESYAKPDKKIDKGNVLELLYSVVKYNEYSQYIKENSSLIQRYFGVDITAPDSDSSEMWSYLEKTGNICEHYYELLCTIFSDEAAAKRSIVNILMQCRSNPKRYNDDLYALKKALVEYEESELEFCKTVSINITEQKEQNKADWYNYLTDIQSKMLVGFDGYKQWVNWLVARDVAISLGLKPVVSLYESGKVDSKTLPAAFLKGFFKSASEAVIESEPIFKDFDSERFISLCNTAKECGERKNDFLLKNLSCIANSSMMGASASLKDLDGEYINRHNVRGNIKPLNEYYSIIVTLKDSVRELIEPGDILFDHVIFDDADQLESELALPLFKYGRKLVFIGNPDYCKKFSGACINMRNKYYESNRSVSLMSEVSGLGIPSVKLTKNHITDERTAAFINRYYRSCGFETPYRILPCIERQNTLKLTRVGGSYDIEGSGTNVAEAAAIVDEIIRIESAGEPKSICVYTMNAAQKHLIEALLFKRVANHDEIKNALFANEDEPLVVRDITNLPTEPRDVVLLSLTYALPAKSKYFDKMTCELEALMKGNAFAALSGVASLAKQTFNVFCSFGLVSSRSTSSFSEECSYLKKFVHELYSSVNSSYIAASRKKNPIAEELAKRLSERGFDSVINYGFGDLYVDLAVMSPEAKDECVLAVVLDNSALASGQNFYDREIEFMSAVEKQPWKVVRIFNTDWFMSRESCIESVLRLLLPESEIKIEE